MSTKSTENTVFVRFIPPSPEITRFHVEEIFSELGPIKKCSIIRSTDNVGLGYGFCKFVSSQDAKLAATTYNHKSLQVQGRRYTLTVELASSSSKEQQQKSADKQSASLAQPDNKPTTITSKEEEDLLLLSKKKKSSRVILRNVSFYANEHHIRSILEKEYGPILELTLPKVSEKLHRGFCFITFEKQRDAQRAVQPRTAPLLIKKRPVAIDYAVSKHVHQQQQQKKKHAETNKKESNDDDSSSSSDEDDDSSDEEEQVDENDGDQEMNEQPDDAVQANDKDDDKDSSDEDDISSTGSIDHDDVEEERESEQNDEKQSPQNKVPPPKHDEAVDHHRSLFVRNLPFDATRHDLFQLFSPFGHLESIYLVKDQNTGVQKGTAFLAFKSAGDAEKALEAAGSSGFVTQRDEQGGSSAGSSGLHLRGRRLFVDVAVDKKTAASLTVEKQGNKVTGKDRRNLYLKMEGRVANEADGNTSNNAWENLPESDQLKRQRAFSEKNTKLRSPLFFINSKRLSVRNLAKHVDEAMFKKLCVDATRRGLDTPNLVTQEDQVAHWRASGEMTTRDIMKRIDQAKEESGSVIPAFDEKNVKKFIPSVYIDRDFSTNKKEKAPSRGFGFVDFEHHAHALACLRELNNNPYYAAEYVAGGRKAVDAKKQARNKRKGKKGEEAKGEFVSEDGRSLTPRLIVDFTVENTAKAKKQAENRAQQQANIEKQRLERKEKRLADGKDKKQQKKKRRGAAQREKKRKQRESGEVQKEPSDERKQENASEPPVERETRQKVKSVKPPKKKRKVDEEEQNFENLVDSYRKAFSGVSEVKDGSDVVAKVQSQPKKKERRWFE